MFMTKNGFTMNGYKSTGKAFWSETSNVCEPGQSPYLGGLKEIESKVTKRSRKTNRDHSHVPFNATVAAD